MGSDSIYAHTTSVDTLDKILQSDSKRILSLRHIAAQNPDLELSVEPLPIPIRKKMPAAKAYSFMQYLKDPDSIFFTRNGYLPNYGDVVITKKFGDSIKPRYAMNSIPEEHTTTRQVSLRNNARVYVPDALYDKYKKAFKDVNFNPISKLELKPYTITDRLNAFVDKLQRKFEKTSSDAKYKRQFGRNACLVGSDALGINLPDSSDTDVFVPYTTERNFLKALDRMKERHPELKMNSYSLNKPDKKTFTGVMGGKPIDVVIAHGPRAQRFSEAFANASGLLDDKRKAEIIAEKQRLKSAWLFPEFRYKRYKKQLAEELGLRQAYF